MNRLSFFLFLFLSLFSVSVCAQDYSDEVIRVDTSLVVVPVRVVDSNGRFIPNLARENFRILEDKTEQKIAYFDTDTAPFAVALMLDVSDSATFKLKAIQDAAIAFLNQLRPNDTVMVFAFDANLVKVYEGDTWSLSNLQESIRLMHTGGGTSLYDAVDTVNNYLSKASQRKKAIVLLTDGIDTTSRETYIQSLRTAQESNALIYSIQYDTSRDIRGTSINPSSGTTLNIVTAKGEPLSSAYKHGTIYLNFLSANSGGRLYFAATVESLTKVFAQIASELSQQYVLSYYPQNRSADGKQRNIKISVNKQNAKVRARKNYTLNPHEFSAITADHARPKQ